MKKKEKTISFLDKILVDYFGAIPNKPEVRAYLDKCAKEREIELEHKGIILSSKSISKVMG